MSGHDSLLLQGPLKLANVQANKHKVISKFLGGKGQALHLPCRTALKACSTLQGSLKLSIVQLQGIELHRELLGTPTVKTRSHRYSPIRHGLFGKLEAAIV